MIRRPPRSTRTDTRFPYTTLVRSCAQRLIDFMRNARSHFTHQTEPPDMGQTLLERTALRSEEHTSELQSLMRISYAVFCLKKKKIHLTTSTKKVNTHTMQTQQI